LPVWGRVGLPTNRSPERARCQLSKWMRGSRRPVYYGVCLVRRSREEHDLEYIALVEVRPAGRYAGLERLQRRRRLRFCEARGQSGMR
jgi:hypothetical protein